MPNIEADIGMEAHKAPSVFNFYSPDYAPPGPLGDAGLVSPEAELATTPLLIGFLNGATARGQKCRPCGAMPGHHARVSRCLSAQSSPRPLRVTTHRRDVARRVRTVLVQRRLRPRVPQLAAARGVRQLALLGRRAGLAAGGRLVGRGGRGGARPATHVGQAERQRDRRDRRGVRRLPGGARRGGGAQSGATALHRGARVPRDQPAQPDGRGAAARRRAGRCGGGGALR